jgi:hypothetical protein
MNKDINNYNIKGKRYGYHEWYGYDDKISLRCKYKNDIPMGYEEWHLRQKTNFYIR